MYADNVLMFGCTLCPSALLSFPGQEHGPSRPHSFRQKLLFFVLARLPLHLGSSPATQTVPVHRSVFDGQLISVLVALYLFPHHVSHKCDQALNERNFRFPLLTVARREKRANGAKRLLRGENVFLQVVATEVRSAFLCQKSDRFDK